MTKITIELNSDSTVTISKNSNVESESTYTGVLGKEDLKEIIGLFIDDFVENNDI